MIPFNHLGWIFKYFGPFIYSKKIRESLCTFLKPLPNSAFILDLGAGTGMMSDLAYACREDLHFTAVDPAEGMLKYTAEYIQTHKGNAEALPFDTNSFEAILIGEALHHFQDIDQSIEEIVRVLKNEGRLFIYDFNTSTFVGKILCIIEKILGEPGNFFDPDDLQIKLEACGFSCRVSKHGWRYTVDAFLQK
jgi:demethylmenaquinone methyltransferase/2-methoxy-6-polyprenyl-1,4-benzoquinol methylase